MQYEGRSLPDTSRTDIATGGVADFPAILRYVSVQDQDAVLILSNGNELIAFPGLGG